MIHYFIIVLIILITSSNLVIQIPLNILIILIDLIIMIIMIIIIHEITVTAMIVLNIMFDWFFCSFQSLFFLIVLIILFDYSFYTDCSYFPDFYCLNSFSITKTINQRINKMKLWTKSCLLKVAFIDIWITSIITNSKW